MLRPSAGVLPQAQAPPPTSLLLPELHQEAQPPVQQPGDTGSAPPHSPIHHGLLEAEAMLLVWVQTDGGGSPPTPTQEAPAGPSPESHPWAPRPCPSPGKDALWLFLPKYHFWGS